MDLSVWLILPTILVGSLAYTMFARRNAFPVAGRTIIITGGSQGLGLSLATLLASKGANTVIVAQTVSKLESALKQIQAASTKDAKHTYLSYDLRDPKSAPAILESVTKWQTSPDIVINCAGNCVPGFFADLDIDTLRGQMDTIYWSCAYMAYAALRSWLPDPKPRHLVFVGSVLALYTIPGYAAYSPAKAAMRSLADSLNGEVQVYNGANGGRADIKVHMVFPTGILTPGFETENATKPGLTQKLEEDDKPQTPDELARIVVGELEQGKFLITASLIGNIMRGWSMGGSQRTGVSDWLYNWLGSLIVPFVTWDHFGKSWKWGKEKGLGVATK